jgi:hypothetical protein
MACGIAACDQRPYGSSFVPTGLKFQDNTERLLFQSKEFSAQYQVNPHFTLLIGVIS